MRRNSSREFTPDRLDAHHVAIGGLSSGRSETRESEVLVAQNRLHVDRRLGQSESAIYVDTDGLIHTVPFKGDIVELAILQIEPQINQWRQCPVC